MSDSRSSELVHSHRPSKVRRSPSNSSRREFLSRAGSVVAGLAAKTVTGVPSIRDLEGFAAGSDDSSKGNETEGQVASSQIAPIQAENIPGKHAAFGLFRGLSTEEAEELNDRVNGYVIELVNQREVPQLRLKANQYLKQVKGFAQENGFMAQNMMGIILTESRFDPNAVSDANAAGLCGIKPETANHYKSSASKRFDPVENIRVASEFMGDNERLFVDESLAIWAHHAGPGNVMDAISIEIGDPTFNAGDYGDAIDKGDYKERERIEKLVGAYVRGNDLNFYKLMKNEKVVSWVKNNPNLEDETLNYPYRVLAGAVVLGFAKF